MTIKHANILYSKALTKFTPIGIFGLKIYHLATLYPIGENVANLVALFG
jgi:hypothetical protein